MPAGDPRPCQCLHCHCQDSWYQTTTTTPIGKIEVAAKSDDEQRDDFAQSALQGLIASFSEKDRDEWRTKFKMSNERIAKQFAVDAYQIAQAMMKERAALQAISERGDHEAK